MSNLQNRQAITRTRGIKSVRTTFVLYSSKTMAGKIAFWAWSKSSTSSKTTSTNVSPASTGKKPKTSPDLTSKHKMLRYPNKAKKFNSRNIGGKYNYNDNKNTSKYCKKDVINTALTCSSFWIIVWPNLIVKKWNIFKVNIFAYQRHSRWHPGRKTTPIVTVQKNIQTGLFVLQNSQTQSQPYMKLSIDKHQQSDEQHGKWRCLILMKIAYIVAWFANGDLHGSHHSQK